MIQNNFPRVVAYAPTVVRSYIQQEPPSWVQKAAEQIDEVLSLGMTEEELQEFLYAELGCYYMPTAEGVSYSHWLRSVRDLLRQSTS